MADFKLIRRVTIVGDSIMKFSWFGFVLTLPYLFVAMRMYAEGGFDSGNFDFDSLIVLFPSIMILILILSPVKLLLDSTGLNLEGVASYVNLALIAIVSNAVLIYAVGHFVEQFVREFFSPDADTTDQTS